jgi:hypothetical protein
MKNIKLTWIATALLASGVAFFAACSSDETTAAGPLNHADGGITPDSGNPSGNTDGGQGGGGSDASTVDDSGYNVCAKGLVFDNTRVPGYPNPPQP